MAFAIRDGMHIIEPGNIIDGAEGTIYAIVQGQKYGMALVQNLTANAEKTKDQYNRLGTRTPMHRSRGVNLTGSMSVYSGGKLLQEMMFQYIKDGVDVFFEIVVTNEDPTSNIGRRVASLKNVNLDNVLMTSVDIETGALAEDVSFTFDDIDYLDQFDNEGEYFG